MTTQHLVRPLLFIWLIIVVLMGLAVGMSYLLPSDNQIAYTNGFDSNNSRNLTIFLKDVERKLEGRLTARYGLNALPKWSPNGQRIAYLSLTDSVFHPYVMDAMGGNKRQLTFQFTTIDSGYVWSPDSQWVLFSATGEGIQQSVVINIITGQVNLLPRAIGDGVWSPDSQTIIYQSAGEDSIPHLYGLNVNCFGQQKPCEFKELGIFQNQAIYDKPIWSPDGHSAAFISETDGNPKLIVAHLLCVDLFEACVDQYKVVSDKPVYLAPIWSADSKQLAYVTKPTEINIAELETGKNHSIIVSGGVAFLLDWSPDGQFITYVADSKLSVGNTINTILNVTSGNSAPLFPNSITSQSPEWRPLPR